MFIPVNEPLLGAEELANVTTAVKTGWISSEGKFVKQFEDEFAGYIGVKYGVAVCNGTAALHLALATLGIGKGDEVIVPAFTMIASVYAIIYCGATPVLVDADPETWCMDVSQIEKKITRKTKAIMPVHIYGHPVDMDPLLEIAKKHKLIIVEDAAEIHGGEYKGRKAGGLGEIGCFSFYANKIITTGEGGMLVTNDQDIYEKAKILRNMAFSEGKRYIHYEIGFNYRMTNLQAAVGLGQLHQVKKLLEIKIRNAHSYNEKLKHIPGITLPVQKPWAKNVYWMYSILIEKDFGLPAGQVQAKLKEMGVDTRALFVPMHQQPVLLKMGLFSREKYPVSEELSQKGFYLPSGTALTEEQIEVVCQSLAQIKKQH